MAAQSEAFSRALIDAQLEDAGWKVRDGVSVRFEYSLSDATHADYLLCDRDGRGLAVVEAKRTSLHAPTVAEQAKHYADLANVPFVFLANGREVWFWDYRREAHPRQIATFYSQADLERRAAVLQVRRNVLDQWRDIHPFAVGQFDQRMRVEIAAIRSAGRLYPRPANGVATWIFANVRVHVIVALG